jgi:hypothetical protein
MFVLLFVGFFLFKKKWLSDEATRQMSNIAISLINPIVIFNAYQTDFDAEMIKGLLYAMGLALVAQTILILAGVFTVRKGVENSAVERFAMSYSNCAFMGIPLVEATFGSEGVFYLTGFITIFNLFTWTHGVILMSGNKRRSAKETAKELLKIAVSPAIMAIVIGLIFFFTGLRLPAILQQPLDYLGAMNTPLAMLVSGATIAKAGILEGFKKKRVYYVQSFKLLIVPILLSAIFVPLQIYGVDKVIIRVILIAAAAPTASSTIMFSYKYGHDAEYASNHFTVSTLLSIVTMPVVLMLAEFMESLLVP